MSTAGNRLFADCQSSFSKFNTCIVVGYSDSGNRNLICTCLAHIQCVQFLTISAVSILKLVFVNGCSIDYLVLEESAY